MTARCICPPPVTSEAVQLDDYPVHGEEARAGWGEEEGA